MSDERTEKELEEVLTTANIVDIHPISASVKYSFKTNYLHLSPHSPEWEETVLDTAAFVPRWLAEEDSSIVQIIPYIICCTAEGKLLSYTRKGGGEGRLEGKKSIGIGGHVNNEDFNDLSRAARRDGITWDLVLHGAARELEEEIGLKHIDIYKDLNEIGIIYTPMEEDNERIIASTPTVGSVHLGIIYTLEVPENITTRTSEGLVKPKFIAHTPKDISKYELWSSMILEVFHDIRIDS